MSSSEIGALVALVALLHAGFLVLEMFLWTTPRGRAAFGTDAEFAEASKALAANQGQGPMPRGPMPFLFRQPEISSAIRANG